MDLGDMIQECTEDSARWFPGKMQRPENLTLALAGEVGEMANIMKKVVRGSITMEEAIDPSKSYNLPEEIIDVLIYLCNLMGDPSFNLIDWEDMWEAKRQFNEERFGGAIVNPTEPWFERDQRV